MCMHCYHSTFLQQVVHDFTALDTESLIESDLHPLAEAGRVVLAQREEKMREEKMSMLFRRLLNTV
jgi:hypothetical protein